MFSIVYSYLVLDFPPMLVIVYRSELTRHHDTGKKSGCSLHYGHPCICTIATVWTYQPAKSAKAIAVSSDFYS